MTEEKIIHTTHEEKIAYVRGHPWPWTLIKRLTCSRYRTIDILSITFSNMSNHFSSTWIICWKCFPYKKYYNLKSQRICYSIELKCAITYDNEIKKESNMKTTKLWVIKGIPDAASTNCPLIRS